MRGEERDEMVVEETESTDDELAAAEQVPTCDRPIITQPFDWSVREIFDMEQEGTLVLQPDFQRKEVWDDGKRSRLIESILLGVPLPIVYVAEDQGGYYSVIDGQQRLAAIIRYLKNQYALRGLRVLNKLKNKKFQHLAKPQQLVIKGAAIRSIVIKKESDPAIRFEIFERLNTGAVPLNPQELRNCVYRGPFNDMLGRLERYPDWLRVMRLDAPDKRMRDRELILRFFALYDRYNKYAPPMKRFLNIEMQERRNASARQIKEYESLFKNVVRMVLSVFGDHAFMRFVLGDESDPNGHWEGRTNFALYDVVMYSFAQYEERDVVPRSEAIAEALMQLMTTDEEFVQAITYNTSQKDVLRTRISIWENRLRQICKRGGVQGRVFPFSLRKELFEQNATCYLCGNRIVLIDDAVIDHDLPWSRGGPTTLANARLAHRYCNIAKGNKTTGRENTNS